MSLGDWAQRVGKFATDNSPAILTGIAVTGTITTAVLAFKGGMKAEQILQEDLDNRIHEYGSINRVVPATTREKLEMTWKSYLPAAGAASLTIAAIILSNRIGTRRAAALAATYAITEKAFVEYKDKVVEKLGGTKEQVIRDEIAQDRVTRNPLSDTYIIGEGSILCYEAFTGRYFLSSMEELKKAQNDLNYRVLHDYYASLTDFYTLVGLPKTSVSDDFGWNSEHLLELNFSTTLAENGRPCLVLDYHVVPIRDFYRVN